MARQRKLNAMHQAKLIRLLLEGTYSARELADTVGLAYLTVLQYLRELRREKVLHVAEWEQDDRGKWAIRIFKLGAGRDAPKPPALTDAQVRERQRERERAAAQLQVLAGRAAYVKAKNGRVVVQPTAASSSSRRPTLSRPPEHTAEAAT